MTTEAQHDDWLAGRESVTECTKTALRIMRDQVEKYPRITKIERAMMSLGALLASVDDDVKQPLFDLIREGEQR